MRGKVFGTSVLVGMTEYANVGMRTLVRIYTDTDTTHPRMRTNVLIPTPPGRVCTVAAWKRERAGGGGQRQKLVRTCLRA